uniref:Homeobox domain-containing protein n=1 Tax=Ditylenchus dipsaci TaxID=166011 RepID=A0A915ETU3_9BILA
MTTELQRVTFLYERSEKTVYFTTQELDVLHNAFRMNPNPPRTKKQELSEQLQVPTRKITSWFKRQRQNAAKNAP